MTTEPRAVAGTRAAVSVDDRPVARDRGAPPRGAAPRRFDLPVAGWVTLGLLGTVLAVIAGQAQGSKVVLAPTDWFGSLFDAHTVHSFFLRKLSAAGTAVLTVAWLRLVLYARSGRIRVRTVVLTGLVWALPAFGLGPALSADVYAYAADGVTLMRGGSAYLTGPEGAGLHEILRAVDPHWVSNPAPYGPVGLFAMHVASWFGRARLWSTVLLLQTIALAAVAVTGVAVALLTPRRHRPLALAVWLLSPMTVLTLVAGAHIDALLAMLVALALLARRWGQQHPAWRTVAIVLASFATAVKLPAGLLVLVLVLDELRRRGWVRALIDTAVALLAWLLPAWVIGSNPLQVVKALGTPLGSTTVDAPTTAASYLLTRFAHLCHWSGGHAISLTIKILAGLAVVTVTGWALRKLWRGADVVPVASWVLFVDALLSPVLYPWYLAWGLCGVAAVLTDAVRLRWVLIAVAAVNAAGLPSEADGPLGLPMSQVLSGIVMGAIAWWFTRSLQPERPA